MGDWELGEAEFAAKRRRQTWWAGGVAGAVALVVPAAVGIWRHSVDAWWMTSVALAGVVMVLMVPLLVRQAFREAAGKRRPDPPQEPPAWLLRVQTKFLQIVLAVTVGLGLVQVIVLLLAHA